jgi:hypothetical protein
LSGYLKANCTLRVLHINDNMLTDVGCAAISFSLGCNTTLRSLNMCDHRCVTLMCTPRSHLCSCAFSDGNGITVNGATVLASAVQSGSCSLAWLSMVMQLFDAAARVSLPTPFDAGPKCSGR